METIEIQTRKDLEIFRNRVNTGELYLNAKLLNDIDLGNDLWQPIGAGDIMVNPYTIFKGTFDGTGHTISGLYSNFKRGCGLFGVNSGIIRNLTVSGYVKSLEAAGGIAARVLKKTGDFPAAVINCQNKCTVEGLGFVGGIAGDIYDGTIRGCTNYGDVKELQDTPHDGKTAGALIGGIVGYDRGRHTCVESNCNYGNIFVTSSYPVELLIANNYKFNQVGHLDPCKTDRSNLQKGKVLFPFQNSLVGYVFYKGTPLNEYDNIKDMLDHDPNPEYKNSRDETYLHLLCQNKYMISEPDVLTKLIALLATTDIDFTALNKNGKAAADFLPDTATDAKKLIAAIIKEKEEEKYEDFSDTFSDIGF